MGKKYDENVIFQMFTEAMVEMVAKCIWLGYSA